MILNILWGEGLGLAVIPGSESIAFMNAIEHFAGIFIGKHRPTATR